MKYYLKVKKLIKRNKKVLHLVIILIIIISITAIIFYQNDESPDDSKQIRESDILVVVGIEGGLHGVFAWTFLLKNHTSFLISDSPSFQRDFYPLPYEKLSGKSWEITKDLLIIINRSVKEPPQWRLDSKTLNDSHYQEIETRIKQSNLISHEFPNQGADFFVYHLLIFLEGHQTYIKYYEEGPGNQTLEIVNDVLGIWR